MTAVLEGEVCVRFISVRRYLFTSTSGTLLKRPAERRRLPSSATAPSGVRIGTLVRAAIPSESGSRAVAVVRYILRPAPSVAGRLDEATTGSLEGFAAALTGPAP